MVRKILFILLLSNISLKCACQENDTVTQKYLSFAIGYRTIPGWKSFTTSIEDIGGLFRSYGAILNLNYSSSNNNLSQSNYSFGYSFIRTRKDTVTFSPISANPNSYTKYFDLKGIINVLSFEYTWQRFVGDNSKFQPYLMFGGGLLMKFSSEYSGNYSSSVFIDPNGVYPFISESSPVYISINSIIGGGLRHNLNDRLLMYEQIDLRYMLVNKNGTSIQFSPSVYPFEFLTDFKLGLIYKIK